MDRNGFLLLTLLLQNSKAWLYGRCIRNGGVFTENDGKMVSTAGEEAVLFCCGFAEAGTDTMASRGMGAGKVVPVGYGRRSLC